MLGVAPASFVVVAGSHPLIGLYVLLAIVHVGATTTFLGAMIYSVFVMRPGSERFFGADIDGLNDFQMTLAHGGRYKVGGNLALLLASGVGLLAVDHRLDLAQGLLVAAKTLAFALIVGAFWYMSYKLWPRRAFALEGDMPGIMNRFKVAVIVTMTAAFGALAMGVILTQT
jgi:uncharacterized membrane protein